jgi:hypothetical protein
VGVYKTGDCYRSAAMCDEELIEVFRPRSRYLRLVNVLTPFVMGEGSGRLKPGPNGYQKYGLSDHLASYILGVRTGYHLPRASHLSDLWVVTDGV